MRTNNNWWKTRMDMDRPEPQRRSRSPERRSSTYRDRGRTDAPEFSRSRSQNRLAPSDPSHTPSRRPSQHTTGTAVPTPYRFPSRETSGNDPHIESAAASNAPNNPGSNATAPDLVLLVGTLYEQMLRFVDFFDRYPQFAEADVITPSMREVLQRWRARAGSSASSGAPGEMESDDKEDDEKEKDK